MFNAREFNTIYIYLAFLYNTLCNLGHFLCEIVN